MTYRPDIDGLRAVAVIFVIFFHAFPEILTGGFIGVDIFFVISGYLISGVILERLENGSFSFRDFYARRIKRIFPALIVVLACVLFGALLVLTPVDCRPLGLHVLAGAAFFSNILLYKEVGYFSDNAYAKPLLNLWSLGIEEQFYIIFPFLVWLCRRRPRLIVVVIAAGCLLSFWDNIFLHVEHPAADFYLPLSRFWELLAGAVLQSMSRHGAPCSFLKGGAQAKIIFAVLGFGLFAAGLFACGQAENRYPGWMALLPVAGAVLTIGAGPENPLSRLFLSNRGMVLIGKISYPLYLWHWPLLSFAWLRLGRDGWEARPGIRCLLVLLSFILAFATWKLIEKPVRFGALFGRRKIAVLACSACLIGLGGLYTWRNEGFPPLFNTEDKAFFSLLRPTAPYDDLCLKYFRTDESRLETCRYRDVGAADTIALVGDSHSQAAWSGLAELGEKMGFNTLLLGRFPPMPGDETINHEKGILEILSRNPQIRDVIFHIRGGVFFYDKMNGGERVYPKVYPKSYAEMKSLLGGFIEKLQALGKNVILVEDTPDLEVDVRDLIKWNLLKLSLKKDYAPTKREYVEEHQAEFRRLQKELAAEHGAPLITGTLDAFCPDGECLVFDENDMPLYFDDDHLTHIGARKFVKEVIGPFLERRGAGATGAGKNPEGDSGK